MTIYINCRNQNNLYPGVLNAIRKQTLKCNIVFVESTRCPTRLSLLAGCESNIAIFLDEDIVLPQENFLEEIQNQIQKSPDVKLLAAHYLSDKKASYLQKSYNWLTNLWALSSDKTSAPGGFWAVKTEISKLCHDWVEPTEWGGEDTRAIKYLQNKGIKTELSSKFGVYHYPRSNFCWFLIRAFKHGQAKRKWNLGVTKLAPGLFLKVVKNAQYFPALLAHQFFVLLGSTFEMMKSWKARQ